MKMRIAILPSPRLPVLLCGLLLLFLLLCFPYTTATAADLHAPAAQSGCNFAAVDETSLRSAIEGVNQAAGGVCTIQITGYTIALTQPLPPITNANLDELVIDGQAHSIWARRVGRVLDIHSVKQLTMHDLRLTGGLVADTGSGIDDWGGGLRLYCGEDRECSATLTEVSLSGNQAVEGGGLSIYCAAGSRCATRVVDSWLTANQATAGGGITTGFDEANQAFSLELLRTTVWSNRAEEGGGIRLRGADFTAIDSTIRENRATTGGGIAMIASSYILRANLTGSAIFDNEATQRGGGFYIRSADPGDVALTLANSTVSGNRVTDATGIGGGLAMSATYGLQVDLINSTVANNSAATGAGVYFALEDDSFAPATLLTLANSLIADNQGGSACTLLLQQPPVKGVPLLTSRGHNLDSDGSCLPPAVRQAGDIPAGNANLAPLTDNRGNTWTQALQLGSDAIDAGDDAICAAAPINGVDQRGDPRPQGPHCDIGAYERPNPPGCTYPNLIAGDEAALQQAITCVNLAGPGAYTIIVAADIAYSQPISTIHNPVVSNLLIDGQGYTLDAQGHGSVLRLDETNLAVRDLTLRGGRLPTVDGGVTPNLGGGIYATADYGSTTEPSCTLRLERVTITDNEAYSGGGLYYGCEQPLTILDSTFSNNRAVSGGAFSTAGGEEFSTELFISGSTFSNNEAQSSGGAFDMSIGDGGVRLQMVNSTVSSNRVISGAGGGIWITQSSIDGLSETSLINSTIANNQANEGSGVYNRYGSLVMSNTIIADNQGGSNCILFVSDDGNGRFSSNGYNLDSDGTCLPDGVRQPSDLPNGNANLGPLADNGGRTLTHALLAGSVAIDAANNSVCTTAPVNGVDQRGTLRPQGATCDIGAYERVAPAACSYPILTASDEATLRQAVDCLNVAPSGAYTLAVAADIAYSQPLARLSNPALTSVVIAGNGHTLNAQGQGRVLTLTDIPALTLRDLTLTGGKAISQDLFVDGGGVAFDCTCDLACHWTLINTVIRDNQANSGGGIDYYCSWGGGGSLTVQDSIIRDNRATNDGGGLVYFTDEDSQACSVTLRNTLVEGNTAQEGGGLRIGRPRVTISDSTIRNNYATQTGGGMMARISDGFIDMTVLRSTINNNRAGVSGGGVYIASPDQRFDIQFINSTISGNTVDNGNGGGFYLQEREGSLLISLINSTVTQNAATQGAGVHIFDRAEAPSYYTSTLRLTNSLIADNQGSDCTGEAAPGVVFTGQRVLSFGHNLDSDGSCLPPEVRQTGDIPNGNANLGPLADNGGPTLTHQPLIGSQAIDAGNDGVCAAAPVDGVDQRGAARPQGAHCEIGAVETGDGQSQVYTVTKFTDSNDGVCDADCSLREAVDAANRHFGRDEIHLASGVYSLTIPGLVDDKGETIEEDDNARGDLDITDDLWLTGQGADATTIAGNGAQYVFGGGADRIFEVRAGATVTVEGLTVRYGRVSDVGGGLSNHGNLTLNGVHVVDNHAASGFKIGHGGGIFNDGELTITNSRIAGNRALGGEASYGEGGGIRNDGQLTVRQSVITDNSSWDDNDTGFGGGLRNSGTAVLEDCTISNNHTSISGEGGGIYNLGDLTLRNCTVTQNQALKGAGIANRGQEVTIEESFLTDNATYEESGGEGGALYDAGGPTTITHSTIAGNYGASTGGGIVHNSALPMTISASTLMGNRADGPGGAIFNNLVGDAQPLQIVNTTIYSNSALVAGGIAIDGGPVSLLNSTVVGNRATDEGGGLGYAEGVTLVNTIVAGNSAPTGPDCSLPVTSLGHNLIGDTSGCPITLLPTDLTGNPGLAAFVDNGTAGGGHLPLQAGSPALDAGDAGVCAAAPVNGVDQLGVTRPQGAGCDIGAVEATAQGESNFLFVSSRSSGRAGNLTFRDEDIVAYDFANKSWQMIFDGSALGVAKDVDAFAFRPDGGLLLSFNGPTIVPGVGPVDDSDIVLFTPTRLGSETAGSFTLYLRGADVGLTTDGEDVDAIGFTTDGKLVVSTIGDFDAPNAQGRDEDLFMWENGQWQRFFVGANVGLANEDVNGLWIDPGTGELYLTVKDDFAFDTVAIDSDDIFVCTPTQAGGCTFRRFWDSDAHDYGSENLDAIGLGALPATFAADGQAHSAEPLTAEEMAADEESDDLDLVEVRNNVYLPWVVGR